MPSFDVVSEIDMHEVTNAVDQANRVISTRYDFKGVKASFQQTENQVLMTGEAEFHLQQMLPILKESLTKRGIDVGCVELGDVSEANMEARQPVTLRQGIDTTLAKKIVKLIKDEKMKVQASIQGEQVRVTGKKRDDLQAVIALLKQQDLGLPLQFNNFRD